MAVVARVFERGSTMVDRLRTDPEVVVRFRGRATVADHSAGSPHRNSRAAARVYQANGGSDLLLASKANPGPTTPTGPSAPATREPVR